jgi:2-haloacid dehalogenase
MKNPIKAIVFDFGGVLLDWNPHNLYRRYFPEDPEALEEFLREIDFYAWNAEQDRGRSFAEGVAVHSAKFPHHASLIKTYAENWEDSIAGAIEGTVDILRRLKKKSYPLYGLSNWSPETFPLMLKEYSFFDKFDDIVFSGEIKLIKPEPEIYHFLLNRIEYSASECLFIDDSLPNIETARSLGFYGHHFESPEILEIALREYQIL